MRDGGAGRRHALPADHFRLAALDVMDDDRHVAARAVEMRLDDLQRESGGDAGVEGIAASFQNPHADGGGDPMGRGHHAECAFDLRPRGEGARIDIGHEMSLHLVGHGGTTPGLLRGLWPAHRHGMYRAGRMAARVGEGNKTWRERLSRSGWPVSAPSASTWRGGSGAVFRAWF